MENDDLMLKDLYIEGRSKVTSSGEGPDSRSSFVRCDRESSVASSVDTTRSAPVGQVGEGIKKAATQPPVILKEQNPHLFPPPRPSFAHSNTEQLDAIDAQQTATKAPRKRATMEEIRKLEKELIVAKERNMRWNLRWHNEVKKAKVATLEK